MDLVALFVGRFDYPKNEQWLIDVLLAARPKINDLKMIIVGEGPREGQLRQRIAREALEDRVKIFNDTKLLSAYHAADAVLLPSIREGFSLVCAEAMSCGVPCLRTRTSGTRELIIENVTGCSTPIDRAAFVDAAVEFLSNRQRLREMGVAGAALIREHFTFDRQVEQTIALYRRLIEQK